MAYASGAIAQDTTLQRIADALDGGSNIIAPRESGLVASNAYAIGEQFILGGKLYKATAAIAIGDTITPNTNCELSDTITEQIEQAGKVKGVKGNAESTYREGNVNITHADLGMDTTPTANSVNPVTSGGLKTALDGKVGTSGASTNTTVAFTSNDLAANTTAKTSNTTNQPSTVAKLSSGETLASMFNKISSMFASIRKLWNTVGSTSLENGQTLTSIVSEILMANNAGAHNAIYRGKALGSSVTSAQYAAIDAGTFKDLYIGDYWTINGVNYRIAAFDYWLNTGDTDHVVTDHHVVIVPDTNLNEQKMNDSNVTTGAYVGSKMYTTYMNTAKNKVKAAFGDSNILTCRDYLTNATSNGRPSAGAWYDLRIDLMNEHMVYGSKFFEPTSDGTNVPCIYSTCKTILPLFLLRPDLIGNLASWWLRDVVSGANFACVAADGNTYAHYASVSIGVRPAFAIYKP